ncbi:MAG: TldD/PmbA family protein [Actinomycetota bacterium]
MRDFLARALDAAVDFGARYADVRWVSSDNESLTARGEVLESVEHADSSGFGVRVLLDGAWGYASSAGMESNDTVRIARTAVDVARASSTGVSRHVELVDEPATRGVWATPVAVDPAAVPLEDKAAVLLAATRIMQRVDKVRVARATMDFLRQHTVLISSEGTEIEQTIVHSGGGIEAIAVNGDEVQQRSYPGSFRGDLGAGGYELVEEMRLADHARQVADEAVALLTAPDCPETTTTLVIDGNQAMLQVHESVGHATELDRVLGMEASFAGTSFVGLGDMNRLQFGSEIVSINADATAPGGLGTFGYDDEGVAAQSNPIVSDGILVGFMSSRETAQAMGASRSNGAMRAEGWENFPIIRMTNVNLLPGAGSLEDLLAEVDDGIYMATNKSWSIDDKRKNFQFACEVGWEIKHGRLGRMVKNPRYTGMTPTFWNSCDAVAGPEEWRMWGTANCGKGQPGQTMRVGHGTAPARFRNVVIGVDE